MRHGTDDFTSPRKEGALKNFFPENPTASAGFEPANWGTKNEKENWRILTNREMYVRVIVKKPTITKTIRLYRLHRFGRVQRMEENIIPRLVYFNLETTIQRGRPRNRW
jgi:hypothetical protein